MTRIDDWLALNPDFANDPFDKMDAVGLLRPEPDVRNVAAIKAELARRTGLMGVGGAWGGRQLVYRHFVQGFGTEAQKQAWAGKCLAVAISEPKVGAHPKLLTTRADRRGDMVELTGEKAWASNAPAADALIVFAIVAEEAGRKRYGAFIVPRGTPGLTIEEMPGFHALRPSKHARVVLDRCAVPASAQLGPDGSAYERMALTFRDVEDAVGAHGLLGAFQFLLTGLDRGSDEAALPLGGIVGLIEVFAAAADTVVESLQSGRFASTAGVQVGLRVLGHRISDAIHEHRSSFPTAPDPAAEAVLSDIAAVQSIAKSPRDARQVRLAR